MAQKPNKMEKYKFKMKLLELNDKEELLFAKQYLEKYSIDY